MINDNTFMPSRLSKISNTTGMGESCPLRSSIITIIIIIIDTMSLEYKDN